MIDDGKIYPTVEIEWLDEEIDMVNRWLGLPDIDMVYPRYEAEEVE